jgi:phosphorylated CTD-interacting factor 1
MKDEKDEITLTFKKQSFNLNSKHFQKLKRLYKENDEAQFLPRLFCLLARYSALDGAGYQAALPERVFEGLNKHMEISHEGFASPLNCYFESFGSAFYDIDRFFGSRGSFFEFAPTSGSYEVNPPFVEEVMVAMAIHIENLLNKTDDALSFVIIVPGWTDIPSYDVIKKSKFLKEEIVLQPYDHYYMEGFQHNMRRQEKKAQCKTFVFFMQTDKAKPVSKDIVNHINRYFRV